MSTTYEYHHLVYSKDDRDAALAKAQNELIAKTTKRPRDDDESNNNKRTKSSLKKSQMNLISLPQVSQQAGVWLVVISSCVRLLLTD